MGLLCEDGSLGRGTARGAGLHPSIFSLDLDSFTCCGGWSYLNYWWYQMLSAKLLEVVFDQSYLIVNILKLPLLILNKLWVLGSIVAHLVKLGVYFVKVL